MSVIFPIDLPSLFLKEIEANKRPPDGLLHASGDLNGSLRHSMLRAAGAPQKARSIASGIRLQHGTLWHEWFHATLVKHQVPFFHEVNLTPYMPEGWSGTADWVFWHPDYNAFILGDLKTAKGEGLYWINKMGAKDDHIWQLSAYYYALLAMGLPMVKGFGIMYWPMNDTNDGELVLPTLQECEPVPEDVLLERMESRWTQTREYLAVVNNTIKTMDAGGGHWIDKKEFINDKLAAVQERIQKLIWNKPQGVFDVKLVPHWSAAFCDFEDSLCDCSTQGTTKIGHFQVDGEFVPRKGYEDVLPTVRPSLAQLASKRKEFNDS